eukprot:GHVQ01032960.1.p1 GENE.GHVQ01032960.1~~GHVQ01032960.1.p1  ORF type:complete len:1379 (-),score=187.98 GHVQ01032960.1:308-4444(-)
MVVPRMPAKPLFNPQQTFHQHKAGTDTVDGQPDEGMFESIREGGKTLFPPPAVEPYGLLYVEEKVVVELTTGGGADVKADERKVITEVKTERENGDVTTNFSPQGDDAVIVNVEAEADDGEEGDEEFDWTAQVTVIAVDQVMLDLRKHDVVDIYPPVRFQSSNPSQSSLFSTLSSMISYQGMLAVNSYSKALFSSDPYIDLVDMSSLGPVSSVSHRLQSEYSSFITPAGSPSTPRFFASTTMFSAPRSAGGAVRAPEESVDMADSAWAPVEKMSNAADSVDEGANSVDDTRSDFVSLVGLESAVMEQVVDGVVVKGKRRFAAKIRLETPDNIGTINVRAYVVMKKTPKSQSATYSTLYWGLSTSSFVLSLHVYLTPFAPHVLRSEDKAHMGVILSADRSLARAEIKETVTLRCHSLRFLSFASSTSKNEEVNESVSQELVISRTSHKILFYLQANQGLGDASFVVDVLRHDASSTGRAVTDSVLVSVPVKPFARRMSAATSRPIAPRKKFPVMLMEGVSVPSVYPSMGGVTVAAGVGFKGAITRLLHDILKQCGLLDKKTKTSPPRGEVVLSSGQVGMLLMHYHDNADNKNEAVVERGVDMTQRMSEYMPPRMYGHMGFLGTTWKEVRKQVQNWQCVDPLYGARRSGLDCYRIDVNLTAFAVYVHDFISAFDTFRGDLTSEDREQLVDAIRTYLTDQCAIYYKSVEKIPPRERSYTFLDYLSIDTVSYLYFVLSTSADLGGSLKHKECSESISFHSLAEAMLKLPEDVSTVSQENQGKLKRTDVPRHRCEGIHKWLWFGKAVMDTAHHHGGLRSATAKRLFGPMEEGEEGEEVIVRLFQDCGEEYFGRSRVQGQTAYLTVSPASNYPLSETQQGLWINVVCHSLLGHIPKIDISPRAPASFLGKAELGNLDSYCRTSQLIPKVASYLSAGGVRQTAPYLGRILGRELVAVANGLKSLDEATESHKPDVRLQVGLVTTPKAGAEEPLTGTSSPKVNPVAFFKSDTADGLFYDETFTQHQLGPIEKFVSWETLEEKHGLAVDTSMQQAKRSDGQKSSDRATQDFRFFAQGDGTVMYLLSMEFVLKEPIIYPTYRGILVKRRLAIYDRVREHCGDEAVDWAVEGSLVCVIVDVVVKDYLRDVQIFNLLPGGLEPTDLPSPVSPTLYRWWLPTCAMETASDSIKWQCSYLWPGTHTFSALLIANVHGVYAHPAAMAEAVQQPEVMGNSAGGMQCFVVVEEGKAYGTDKFAVYQVEPPPEWITKGLVQSCPTCSAGTSCNPGTGECDSFQLTAKASSLGSPHGVESVSEETGSELTQEHTERTTPSPTVEDAEGSQTVSATEHEVRENSISQESTKGGAERLSGSASTWVCAATTVLFTITFS